MSAFTKHFPGEFLPASGENLVCMVGNVVSVYDQEVQEKVSDTYHTVVRAKNLEDLKHILQEHLGFKIPDPEFTITSEDGSKNQWWGLWDSKSPNPQGHVPYKDVRKRKCWHNGVSLKIWKVQSVTRLSELN